VNLILKEMKMIKMQAKMKRAAMYQRFQKSNQLNQLFHH
jgi:hypothetical protein